jgi:hypothetical protein
MTGPAHGAARSQKNLCACRAVFFAVMLWRIPYYSSYYHVMTSIVPVVVSSAAVTGGHPMRHP